jgi:PAS domain S-box-containing protein
MKNLLKALITTEFRTGQKLSYEQLVEENKALKDLLLKNAVAQNSITETRINPDNNSFCATAESEDQHRYLTENPLTARGPVKNEPVLNKQTKPENYNPMDPMTETGMTEGIELNNSLLKSIPFGINIVNEEGTILYQNQFLSNNLKVDAIKKKCWTIFRDDKSQCLSCPLLSGIQIGRTDTCETSGILGGRIFQITHTGMVFRGTKAMLEIFQDITEKNQIKQKVDLLAHSLKSITDCVCITDQEDQIIYVNNSFLETYGYTENELVGKNIALVRPPGSEHLRAQDLLSKNLDGGWRGEILNKKKDGTLFPVHLSSSAIRDENGKIIAIIGVAMDITEERNKKAELLEAKELAEESNRMKTSLFNNLSHEIRTPMNAIIGFSNLLQDADMEEKKTYAEIIRKSSNHLLKLIDDVILISRLKSEKILLNVHECIPAEIVGHVYQIFQHSELTKGLKINTRIPEHHKHLIVRSDEDKIVQILTNLVSNAAKYTLEGSVEIGFNVYDCVIEYYVEDTGIGIPKKELLKIFENFYRGEQVRFQAIRGHGLGLCITRELVELMGGTISVMSEVNKGSRFSFTVPFKSSANADKH